jgi:hypothetical protein
MSVLHKFCLDLFSGLHKDRIQGSVALCLLIFPPSLFRLQGVLVLIRPESCGSWIFVSLRTWQLWRQLQLGP